MIEPEKGPTRLAVAEPTVGEMEEVVVLGEEMEEVVVLSSSSPLAVFRQCSPSSPSFLHIPCVPTRKGTRGPLEFRPCPLMTVH
jgi:hypothetical protein